MQIQSQLLQLSENKIAIYPMIKGYIAIFDYAGDYRNFLMSLDCFMIDLICAFFIICLSV